MKRVGDVCQLWLQVLVVEEVLGACYIKNIRGKLIQRMLESLLGYFKRSGNELVAVFDGFPEKFLVIGYHHQTVLRLVLGVEQTDVDEIVAQLEVVLQYTIVEQQLYIVGHQLETVVVRVCLMAFDIEVSS